MKTSIMKTPTSQKRYDMFKAFDEGQGLVVESISEAIALEDLIRLNRSIKWGGEEKLGFRRIDIHKDEYPVIFFQRDGKLWWDNYKETEEDDEEVHKDEGESK